MNTILICNETSVTKKRPFLKSGWPMHPGFGVEHHTNVCYKCTEWLVGQCTQSVSRPAAGTSDPQKADKTYSFGFSVSLSLLIIKRSIYT